MNNYFIRVNIYSIVPSENKKDQRSIEETLADIRAKKKKVEPSSEVSQPEENIPE